VANWFTKLIDRNKAALGIQSITPAPGSSTSALGEALGGLAGFVTGFTAKAGSLQAKSQPDPAPSGYLASFTSNLRGFGPLMFIGAVGVGLYFLLRKR